VGCYACKGELDIVFDNADLVQHCLLIVAIVGLTDNDFDLLIWVLCVVQLDDLMTAQRIDFIVDYGEFSIGDIVKLVVFFNAKVFTGLLNLSQYLLCLGGQHPLIQLFLLFDFSLFPGLIGDQLLVKLLAILFLFQLHDNLLLFLSKPIIPIIDFDAFISVLIDIDDIYLALPDLLIDGGLHFQTSTL
jgi:hypothetical protein